MRQARPRIDKGAKYVFVRNWTHRGLEFEMGDEVPSDISRYRFRYFHRKRIIGIEGDDWTENRMAFYRTKFNLPPISKEETEEVTEDEVELKEGVSPFPVEETKDEKESE